MDRDGVINQDTGYLSRWEAFHFLPGVVQALRELQDLGYGLVVITNQSGIARGLYTEHDYQCLTTRMRQALCAQGVRLSAVLHCPHHPEAVVPAYRVQCLCRKPGPGLILQAMHRLPIDLPASILVGDQLRDLQAGRAAGVGRCFAVGPQAGQGSAMAAWADACFADLAQCVASLQR